LPRPFSSHTTVLVLFPPKPFHTPLQAILALEPPPCTPRRTDTLAMSDANSKDYTADLTRLQRYRDKVQPTNAKAFSGDITNSSFSDMVCELELQLATKDLLEFTEFPGTELPPAANQAVDPPPAPVLRVGAESADHRTRASAASYHPCRK